MSISTSEPCKIRQSKFHLDQDVPWWQVNVPVRLREEICPDYLRNLSAKDIRIIGTKDEDYEYMEWPLVKQLVCSNRIDLFQRRPSELRKYRAYAYRLVKDYGSIVSFVLKERLKWSDLRPNGPPFSNPDDFKILYNDWPYGLSPNIVHLVVWTKFKFEDEPRAPGLTPAARRMIDDFVDQTFCSRMKRENVTWFKNWHSLKSVHAVEHFHVVLKDPDMSFVSEITSGDIPLAATVTNDT